MEIMVRSLFRVSVSLALLGMVLGIFMGIRHDFSLMPAHAHLNLLGFVTMFLSALYYRAVPQAAASRLARYQAIVSIAGAVLFPAGIAYVLLGGPERFEPVVVAGALTVLLGMALFAAIVFRTADPA
jgi:drug/metabolite transporter (DMT)-like permease